MITAKQKQQYYKEIIEQNANTQPIKAKQHNKILKVAWIDSKLGPMMTIVDDNGVYLLEFIERKNLKPEIERLRKKLKAAIIPGETAMTESIKDELEQYFEQQHFTFKTPLHIIGSPFQKQVWQALQNIPPGETRSYADIAKAIKQPKSYRAVARANGSNQIAIVIPCHRVINSDGELGGYAGGISRKAWLLKHEKT